MNRNKRFELSEEQWDKYDKWVDSLPERYFSADSSGITIYFPSCSIGYIVKAKRGEGEEIDLTDWNNF